MKKSNSVVTTVLLGCAAVWSVQGSAIENSSYIQEIKDQMRQEGQVTEERSNGSDSYIDSLKKDQVVPVAEDPVGYSQQLKEQNARDEKQEEGPSYLERERLKLKPKEQGGAIAAVLEGKSEIAAKEPGDIHYAVGLRYGVSLTRMITAGPGVGLRDFNDIYGARYAPDFTLFYEYQPFHSEWFGNIGIVGMAGLGYYRGVGQYGISIPKPNGGTGDFSANSTTQFQFIAIPVTVALDYRFNLLRLIRPYILAGPTAVGFFETRSDSVSGNRGYSGSLLVSVGASIQLDGMDPQGSLDLYATHGIHNYYLTVDYSRLIPFYGDVQFGMSGFTVGFAFEY